MTIGDQVNHSRLGWNGVVEAIAPDLAPSGDRLIDVRWLLDDGVTVGCGVSMCWQSELRAVDYTENAQGENIERAFRVFIAELDGDRAQWGDHLGLEVYESLKQWRAAFAKAVAALNKI